MIAALLILFTASSAFCENVKENPEKPEISINTILTGLEKRYESSGFSAKFYQESPIPDIQMTDSASGKAFFKRPGKFRWEYEEPDILHYISDGKTLWIHSPVDNHVWLGDASAFFGKGSSANFLTDIKLIKERFDVSLPDQHSENKWRLKLIPKNGSIGLSEIFISVNKKNYNVSKIVSFNNNGEETRIMFSDFIFDEKPEDSIFSLKIPENANIIPLE